MRRLLHIVFHAASALTLLGAAHATTLPPELKAYDFAEAYYLEDGGIVISPYPHGFYCPRGIQTPEGIRVMPGGTFYQYESGHQICEEYHFLRLDGERAFFHERLYRYHITRNAKGHLTAVRDICFDTDDFYLTQFRGLEWADHVFTDVDLHPGLQEWRSKNYFNGLR
jgi:hypothetical protein